MINAADMIAWLVARGLEFPASADSELPAMPDRVITVIRAGGGPTTIERAYDTPQMQVVSRGAQADATSAEVVADRVDDLLLGAVPPVQMGGHRVISIERLGGPPMAFDRDEGRRTLMSCSYILRTARSVL
jgi:hypothetical protein